MTTTPKKLETISLDRLLSHTFPAREDLLTPWLRQGESAMLWAAPGTGKTMLTLTMALAVAGGGTFLGWTSPRPRKVLLVDGEMAAEDLQERAAQLLPSVAGIDREAARRNLMILSRNWQAADVAFPDLADREGKLHRDGTRRAKAGQDVVLGEANKHGAELVLLDNYSTLAEVADENDAAAMTTTLAFLLRMKQARIGCILVHHSGKNGATYRGSSKLATTFEVILGLAPLEDTSAGAAFKLDWTKYRREPCDAVRARNVRLVKDATGSAEWRAEASDDDDVRKLLEAVGSCHFGTQREVATHLDWDPAKVSRTKNRAIQAGKTTKAYFDGCMQDAAQNATAPNGDF